MSLTTRTPLRHAKPYATEDAAETAAARLSDRSDRPGAFLAQRCPLASCAGAWHVEYQEAKDTGPDAATRLLVAERDGWCCACCGTPVKNKPWSIGHRKRRSQGGSDLPSNLLLFLGLGNGFTADDHHHRIDQRKDPRDEKRGLTVRSHQDPHLIPVDYLMPDGSGFSRYLADNGDLLEAPPGGEAA